VEDVEQLCHALEADLGSAGGTAPGSVVDEVLGSFQDGKPKASAHGVDGKNATDFFAAAAHAFRDGVVSPLIPRKAASL